MPHRDGSPPRRRWTARCCCVGNPDKLASVGCFLLIE